MLEAIVPPKTRRLLGGDIFGAFRSSGNEFFCPFLDSLVECSFLRPIEADSEGWSTFCMVPGLFQFREFGRRALTRDSFVLRLGFERLEECFRKLAIRWNSLK